MHCLKCGRKIEDQRVFCPGCMEEMEKSPVKHDTVVRLPQRQNTPVSKKRQPIYQPFRKSADQITMLRNRVRWLTAALIIAFLLLLAAAFLVLWLLDWHQYFSLPFWR